MKVKLFLLGICIMCFFPRVVFASDNLEARIGNKYYDTLELAVAAASSDDVIYLMNDVNLDKTLEINKIIHINLNGKNVVAPEKVFLVQGGTLELTGKGKIMETKPNYGAIMVKGSSNSLEKDYSAVSVGSDVVLEGWAGVFVQHNNSTAYGIKVNVDGTIYSKDDILGSKGSGIYVNGNIKHTNNAPVINLSETAKIFSTGVGIYAAGYSSYYINGAHIEGEEAGLGIKSGSFQIVDGTILGTGLDKTPTSGNNNGINPSGTAIQIESNNGYKGNIDLNILDGTFESNHSNVLYEYVVNGADTKVKDINISGGTFNSKDNKDVIVMSSSFQNTFDNFITGGTYSSSPDAYLDIDYHSIKKDGMYQVVSDDVSVFLETSGNSSSILKLVIICGIILMLVTGIYLWKNKIVRF